MTYLYNRHDEMEKRRLLRRAQPPAETLLWQRLRDRQVAGLKFRRQFSIGPFVVDFYCPTLKLAIEADGTSHEGDAAADYDQVRQQYLESFGIRFLRFSNQQIYHQLNNVVATIAGVAAEMQR